MLLIQLFQCNAQPVRVHQLRLITYRRVIPFLTLTRTRTQTPVCSLLKLARSRSEVKVPIWRYCRLVSTPQCGAHLNGPNLNQNYLRLPHSHSASQILWTSLFSLVEKLTIRHAFHFPIARAVESFGKDSIMMMAFQINCIPAGLSASKAKTRSGMGTY